MADSIDVLIVGAGLAGLMAGQALRVLGYRVLLLDKGRSVGGRLATRRMGPGRADHGAQFFTVRDAQFQQWVDQWLATGLVFRWSTGWSDGSLVAAPGDGHPRYAVTDGMNALAKHLAQGLAVDTDIQVTATTPVVGGWHVAAGHGQTYTGRSLLLTPPVPQSLSLLDAGDAVLEPLDRSALERISYAPCLAGLFWLDRPPLLPTPGALQRPGHAIAWIADNQRKGISPEATVVTVHAGPELSQRLWDRSPDEALHTLQEALTPLCAPQTQIWEAQLKRWRYALPTTLHPERLLVAADLPPLVFAGDAFGGARVEGAALSGLAAAQALALRLAPPVPNRDH